jgi:hypothetical protein
MDEHGYSLLDTEERTVLDDKKMIGLVFTADDHRSSKVTLLCGHSSPSLCKSQIVWTPWKTAQDAVSHRAHITRCSLGKRND